MADNEGWNDITDVDFYTDLQSKIPGVRFTSGYRTKAYQADMRRRGYRPAENSGHLNGSKMDLLPPEGKTMDWLKAEVARHYPYARINPNEGDHADVFFPGYTKAPALGGAVAAGVVNPNRPADNDGWEEVKPSGSAALVKDNEGWQEVKTPTFEERFALPYIPGTNESPMFAVPNDQAVLTPYQKEQMAGIDQYLRQNANRNEDEAVIKELRSKFSVGEPDDNKFRKILSYLRSGVVEPYNWYQPGTPKPDDINPDRSMWEKFTDSLKEAGQVGTVGVIARKLNDWADTGKDQLRKAHPELTEEELERLSDDAINQVQGAMRAEAERRQAADPVFRPDESWAEGFLRADRWAPYLAGQVLGGSGPETFIAPGATVSARIGGQAAVAGLADAAAQGVDIADGMQENFSPTQNLAQIGFGGVTQGALEGIGKVIRPRVEGGSGEISVPSAVNEIPKEAPKEDLPPLGKEERFERIDGSGKTDGHDATTYTNDEAIELIRRRTGTDLRKPAETFDAKISNVRPKAEAVAGYVDDLTKTWTNSPDIHVVQKVDQLPDSVRQGVIDDGAQKAPSFIGADGRIYMIADNIKHEGVAKAAIFHEALGHAGLANKFREDLDTFLSDLYDTNPKIAQETDAWMRKNKGAYGGDTVRAVEEVLARKSELGQLPPSLRNRVTVYLRKWARDLGLNLKISDRELSGVLELAQKTVTEGDGSGFVAPSGNKYMRAEDAEEIPEPRKAGNRNLDKMRTTRPDLDSVFKEIMDEADTNVGPVEPLTDADIRDFALEQGLTYNKIKKMKWQNDPRGVYAVRQWTQRQAEELRDLSYKKLDGNFSERDRLKMIKIRNEVVALSEELSGVTRNAGRMLRQFRLATEGREFSEGLLKYMREHGDDIDMLAEGIAVHKDNPAAIMKMVNDSAKPGWEDYITSIHYNMMLSGLGTHATNFLGNATMLGSDIASHLGAAVAGIPSGALGRDRVTFSEVYYRIKGAVQAMFNAQTYLDSIQSYKDGTPLHHIAKMEDHTQRVLPGAIVTEAPRNALAASDQFWRAIMETSHMNGLAMRQAHREGYRGADAAQRVQEILSDKDHSYNIKQQADESVKTLQLIDDASWMSNWLDSIKAKRSKMSGGRRFGRFLAQNVFMFSRVADRLLWAAIRHSPLGVFDRANIKDWKDGGAGKAVVFSRMAMGSMLAGWLWMQAEEGNLAPPFGTESYGKAMQDESFGEQPSSLKVGDSWVPMKGLDPLSILAGIVSGIHQNYKSGKMTEEDMVSTMVNAVGVVAGQLQSNSATSSMSDFFGAFANKEKATSYAANLAAGFVNPAIVRQAQDILDPVTRDATGNGETVSEKFQRRVQAVWDPKASWSWAEKELPIKHDVFGRVVTKPGNLFNKIVGFGKGKPAETNPTLLEVARLAKTSPTALVGPVPNHFKQNGVNIKLSTAEVQEFQKATGDYITSTLERDMQTEEWTNASDDERRKWIQDVSKLARKQAKEDLFGEWEPVEQ